MTTTTFKGILTDCIREHNYPDGTPKYRLTIVRPDGTEWERYVEDNQFAYSHIAQFLGGDCVFTENGLMRITHIEEVGEEDRLFLWHVTGEVGGTSVNMYINADDQASAHRAAIDMLDPERLKQTSLAVTREWLERREEV